MIKYGIEHAVANHLRKASRLAPHPRTVVLDLGTLLGQGTLSKASVSLLGWRVAVDSLPEVLSSSLQCDWSILSWVF